MKLFLTVIFVFVLKAAAAQDVSAELKNIRYCDSCGCNTENPVLVKVCFKTDYKKIKDLKMVVEYNGNFTYTGSVREFDQDGHIYYTFCSKQGTATNFEIFFRSPGGQKSKRFMISTLP